MIIVVLPPETPDEFAAQSFRDFAEFIHSQVPDRYHVDLRREPRTQERGFCADCEKRVVPTKQHLCPHCGGRLHDVARGHESHMEAGESSVAPGNNATDMIP